MRGRLSRREWGRRWVPGGHRKSEAAVHRRTHRNPPEEPRFRGFAIQPQGMSRPLHKAHHRTFIRPSETAFPSTDESLRISAAALKAEIFCPEGVPPFPELALSRRETDDGVVAERR